MRLDGQIVVVTGGFGSLGAAVIAAARAAGARTVALDRAAISTAPASLGDSLLLGDIDLSSPEAAQRAFQTIEERMGGVDALVNVAGGFRWEPTESGSLDTWDFMYGINLRTTVNASKSVLPGLRKRGGGRIVNVSAGAAVRAGAGMGAYAASKAGVAKLTESLAEELKDHRITVNAVLPSIIDTPVNRKDMPDADFSRWVQPAQLADVIVFLLSAQASAVTGALIPVSGRV